VARIRIRILTTGNWSSLFPSGQETVSLFIGFVVFVGFIEFIVLKYLIQTSLNRNWLSG